MRRITSVLLKFVKFGILFLSFFLFVIYLPAIYVLAAQEIEEVKSVGVETHSLNTETSDAELKVKEKTHDLNSYDDYISKMTLLVTVAFFIFTFFIAVNVFTSNQNLKDAKKELAELKNEHIELKNKKNSILEEIKEEGRKSIQEYIDKHRTQEEIKEIQELLSKRPHNKKLIFSKLSEIIEKIDINNASIVTECTTAFQNDENFSRLAKIVLSNITKNPKN